MAMYFNSTKDIIKGNRNSSSPVALFIIVCRDKNCFLEIYPHLNEEDLLFCILSALHFRKRLICYCMKTTSGALRARKNRLKRNLAEDTFQMIFENHKIV